MIILSNKVVGRERVFFQYPRRVIGVGMSAQRWKMVGMTLIAALIAWVAVVPTLVILLRLRSTPGSIEGVAAAKAPSPLPCAAPGRRRRSSARRPARRVG